MTVASTPRSARLLAPALAVNDHAVEAGEQVSPQVLLPGGSPRQEIVRREDRRHARTQQDPVELGRRQPLQMQDVRPTKQQRGRAGQVFRRP